MPVASASLVFLVFVLSVWVLVCWYCCFVYCLVFAADLSGFAFVVVFG